MVPDDAGIGYYRSIPRGDLLERLLQPHKAVTLNDRVGLIGDVTAAVGSGEVQNGVALQLVQMLSKDNDRHIVDQSIAIVAGIVEMVPDNLRANYERFINKLYRTRAHELGCPIEESQEKAFAAAVIDFSQTRTIVTDNDLIAICARVLGTGWTRSTEGGPFGRNSASEAETNSRGEALEPIAV